MIVCHYNLPMFDMNETTNREGNTMNNEIKVGDAIHWTTENGTQGGGAVVKVTPKQVQILLDDNGQYASGEIYKVWKCNLSGYDVTFASR